MMIGILNVTVVDVDNTVIKEWLSQFVDVFAVVFSCFDGRV